MALTLNAGRRGAEYDSNWWSAVYDLYEACFPGVPRGIELAAQLGACWQEQSTPFVLMESGRAIAHAGVIAHPMLLQGEVITIAGVHAVCTAADHRRRGLARWVLTAAIEWAEARYPVCKLHTDVPEVYEPHGFRPVPTHRFRAPRDPAATVRKRRLRPDVDAADAEIFTRMLERRAPASQLCSTADPGWMNVIVGSLSGVLASGLWLLEDEPAIVAFGQEEGRTLVLDVIAPKLPSAALVQAAAPAPQAPLIWSFSPELFVEDPTPRPAPPEAGTFMVRGEWPLTAPFGISPLWEH